MTGQISKDEWLMTGLFSIVRKSLPALKATAYRDVIEILHFHDVYKMVHEHKTDRTISFGGRTIEFFSIDDQQKVRSRTRDILFIPEANELEYKSEFYQLAIRTKFRIYLDLNPDNPDIWINTEIEQKRAALKKDVKVIVSNYKWNLRFLPQAQIDEIEYTKEIDLQLWEVFGKGNYGKLTGVIYKEPEIIDVFPHCPIVIFGVDFGYKDPMTLIKVGVDERNLYIDELFFDSFKLHDDLVACMTSNNIAGNDMIYADSSRPGSIQEIINSGYRGCKPSQKGAGSVADGIKKLQAYKWHITARSQNVIAERRKYKWETGADGEPIEGKPIDMYNHSLDAIRYAVYTHLYKKLSVRQTSTPRRSNKPYKR